MSKKHRGALSVIFISVLLIIGSHFTLLTNPNNFYLGAGIDGFKNYYTLIYHIKYDSTYSHFEGMNYPYGEHVVFTDNQPLISNTLKFISNNIVDISNYTVGIVNVLMLLSIILTCLILYLIFKRFKIPDLWAVLFGIGIGFMAPQIHRMGGHYALAYGFIIPFCFLLWLRFTEKPTLNRSIQLGALVLLSSLLHMYYFAILAFFLVGYMSLTVLKNRNIEQFTQTGRQLFIQVIMPLLLIQLWFFMTDSVDDRPSNPSGFLEYRTQWQGIFLPISYPLGNFIHAIKQIPTIQWEGIAYVGLIPGIFFFGYLLNTTWNFVKSKAKNLKAVSDSAELNTLLLVSVLILIFSFGIPFIWNLEFLIQYLGPIKQFRSIARFSWVFYYAINIVAFIAVFRLIQEKLSSPILRNIVLAATSLFLLYEANMYHNKNPFYQLSMTAELEHPSTPSYKKSPLLSMDMDKYQAILPLPYFHGGSENVSRKNIKDTGKNTMIASLLTGLPTIGVMMSRTSLSQTLNNISLALEPYGPYNVFQDYESDKPLLLWIERGEKLTEDEQALIRAADMFYSDSHVRLARISIQQFYDALNLRYEETRKAALDSTLYQVGGFLTTDSLLNFYHEYLIDEEGRIEDWLTRRSSGSIREKNVIYDNVLPNQNTVPYIASLWVKFEEDNHPTARVYIEEYDTNGRMVFSQSHSFGELLKLLDYDWALLEYKFEPRAKENRLVFYIMKETYQDWTAHWNNLLIRPQNNDLYYIRVGNIIFKNGRIYGPEYFLKSGEIIGQNVY